MISLNMLKKSIMQFAQSHPMVKAFGNGLLTDPNSYLITNFVTPEVDRIYYPLVFMTFDNAQYVANGMNYNISLLFMDRIEELQKTAESPTSVSATKFQQRMPDEIISDMTQLAGDFVSKFTYNFGSDYKITANSNVQFFNDVWSDRVAGARISLTFNIPYLEGLCEIPDSNDPSVFYYGTSNETTWDYMDGTSLIITDRNRLSFYFEPSEENMYLHIAIPSDMSFNIYQRSGYDTGAFEDLFSLQYIIDGYKVYVSNWETGTNQILILS